MKKVIGVLLRVLVVLFSGFFCAWWGAVVFVLGGSVLIPGLAGDYETLAPPGFLIGALAGLVLGVYLFFFRRGKQKQQKL